jgi:hypothetical protein
MILELLGRPGTRLRSRYSPLPMVRKRLCGVVLLRLLGGRALHSACCQLISTIVDPRNGRLKCLRILKLGTDVVTGSRLENDICRRKN